MFIPTIRMHRSPLLLMAALAAGPAHAGDIMFVGDFEPTVSTQSLRDNTVFVPGVLVDLELATVTATALTSGNTKLTLFLDGGGDQWSAIEAFGDAVGQSPAVGDCVYVKGTFGDFGGAAEISSMIWWPDANLFNCPSSTPRALAIGDIATDTNPGMAGNQPGNLAEAYESALVTIHNITVLTTSTHTFEVYDGFNSGTYMLVDDLLYHYDPIVGTHFSSITGVLNEFDGMSGTPVYQLLPRSSSDIVVAP
jgi:hypothetical protein